MTLHHEGALLWAIESTSGSRNFGKRAFSGFYSGEQSFPIPPAPELSGIAGETTLRLQDDTLLVYGLIFHRVNKLGQEFSVQMGVYSRIKARG
jgi:hypothetical protein